MIELGQTVRCKMTGFTGIAEARLEFINGCIQILVRPKNKTKDGEYPTGTYVDIELLDVVKGSRTIKINKRFDTKRIPSGGVRQYPN